MHTYTFCKIMLSYLCYCIGASSTEDFLFWFVECSCVFTWSKLLCGFHRGEDTYMAGICTCTCTITILCIVYRCRELIKECSSRVPFGQGWMPMGTNHCLGCTLNIPVFPKAQLIFLFVFLRTSLFSLCFLVEMHGIQDLRDLHPWRSLPTTAPILGAVVGNGRHRNWLDRYRRARGMHAHSNMRQSRSLALRGAELVRWRAEDIERKDFSPIAHQRKVFSESYIMQRFDRQLETCLTKARQSTLRPTI